MKKILMCCMVMLLSLCTFSVKSEAASSQELQTELTTLQSSYETKVNELNGNLNTITELENQISKNEDEIEKLNKKLEDEYDKMPSMAKYFYENENKNVKSIGNLFEVVQEYKDLKKETSEQIETRETIIENARETITELETKNETITNEKTSLETTINEKQNEYNAEKLKEDRVNTIINAAYSQVGVPYVWGGTTPNVGLDCSGLTQYCYAQAGINIPRLAEDQSRGTVVSNPQPGDIVAYSYHVGIYLGNGMMIAAPKPGDHVKVQPVFGNPWYVRWY